MNGLTKFAILGVILIGGGAILDQMRGPAGAQQQTAYATPVGQQMTLPPKARIYGCENWKTVERLEGEASTVSKESATNMLFREVAAGQCTLLRKGESVLVVKQGFGSFQFRKDGRDWWSEKVY